MELGGKAIERKEVVCNTCTRSRYLSDAEMLEDGWKISTGRGLVCPFCQEKVGMPMEQFRHKSTQEEIASLETRKIANRLIN